MSNQETVSNDQEKKKNTSKEDVIHETIQSLVQKMSELVKTEQIQATHDFLIVLLPKLMPLVENVPELIGADKKKIVLSVLDALVKTLDEPQSHVFLLQYVIPSMIDLVVLASKGGVAINVLKEHASCFDSVLKCFSCFSSQKKT